MTALFYKKEKSMSNQIVGLEGIESEEKVWITPNIAPAPLLSQIDEVLKNEVASRHSYFQLKYFLIGKEPTNQGKMWQCLRELKTRRESLYSLELEVEETKDRLELLDIKVEKIKNPQTMSQFGIDTPDELTDLGKREQAVKLRQSERQRKAILASLESLVERKKWLEEESKFFLETFKSIQKVEPLKAFDNIDAQKQYWGEKLAQKLNLKMLTSNALDSELVETIVALPDDVPLKKQTLTTLNVRHAQMVAQMKDTIGRIEGK